MMVGGHSVRGPLASGDFETLVKAFPARCAAATRELWRVLPDGWLSPTKKPDHATLLVMPCDLAVFCFEAGGMEAVIGELAAEMRRQQYHHMFPLEKATIADYSDVFSVYDCHLLFTYAYSLCWQQFQFEIHAGVDF